MKHWDKLKDFWIQCRRVMRITKKPDKNEFLTIVKVSGLGILLIGFVGFIAHMIYQVIMMVF